MESSLFPGFYLLFMNLLRGTIKDIQVHGNLSLVKLDVSQIELTSIVIETPDTATYLNVGTEINVMFKETEVIIGQTLNQAVSLQNQIPVSVVKVNQGALLSELTLDFQGKTIRSIITSKAVDQLQLSKGSSVVAMIKTNEVMLSE